MWNGAPGSITASACASAVDERLDGRERAVGRRVHVREVDHRPHPVEARRRSRRRRRSSRARARGPSPRSRTARARSLPSRRSRSSPSCSTTESIASSRVRLSRKPGWKTTTSAPAAFAMPAEWSSIPTAMFSFFPRSACPMKPAIGACTERAMSCSRASSPNRAANVVVHPEPALEVDLAGREIRARAEPRRPPPATPARAPAPGRNAVCRAIRRRAYRGPSDRASYPDFTCPTSPLVSICSSSTSTSGSPTSGGRPPRISDWSLDVVAAFMRAAYGKGYCDALTEDSPGALCADHGYRVPGP